MYTWNEWDTGAAEGRRQYGVEDTGRDLWPRMPSNIRVELQAIS